MFTAQALPVRGGRAVGSRWMQGWSNIGACKWHAGKKNVLACTRIRTRGLAALWKIKAFTPFLLLSSYWRYSSVKFRGNLRSKDSKRVTRAGEHRLWVLNCMSLNKNSEALVTGNALTSHDPCSSSFVREAVVGGYCRRRRLSNVGGYIINMSGRWNLHRRYLTYNGVSFWRPGCKLTSGIPCVVHRLSTLLSKV